MGIEFSGRDQKRDVITSSTHGRARSGERSPESHRPESLVQHRWAPAGTCVPTATSPPLILKCCFSNMLFPVLLRIVMRFLIVCLFFLSCSITARPKASQKRSGMGYFKRLHGIAHRPNRITEIRGLGVWEVLGVAGWG